MINIGKTKFNNKNVIVTILIIELKICLVRKSKFNYFEQKSALNNNKTIINYYIIFKIEKIILNYFFFLLFFNTIIQ